MKKKKERKKITILGDFKRFILRGNILDLAVAVIIGGAFGKIVSSLVNDIIMPLVSLALGGVNFSDLKWVIREADELNGITETALNYGNFIQAAMDFLIIAACIFLLIRIVGKLSRRINQLGEVVKQKIENENNGDAIQSGVTQSGVTQSAEQAPPPAAQTVVQPATAPTAEPKPTQEELLTQIRDLLREKNS